MPLAQVLALNDADGKEAKLALGPRRVIVLSGLPLRPSLGCPAFSFAFGPLIDVTRGSRRPPHGPDPEEDLDIKLAGRDGQEGLSAPEVGFEQGEETQECEHGVRKPKNDKDQRRAITRREERQKADRRGRPREGGRC